MGCWAWGKTRLMKGKNVGKGAQKARVGGRKEKMGKQRPPGFRLAER